MVIILVVSPMLGAMTDRARAADAVPRLEHDRLLCAARRSSRAGRSPVSAALFVVANVLYQAGLQFYDALLPEVSTEANRGRISGIGVGRRVPRLVSRDRPRLRRHERTTAALPVIAVARFMVLRAAVLLLRARARQSEPEAGVRLGCDRRVHHGRPFARCGRAPSIPGLLRFLIGRVFYTDAVNTVIIYMLLYVVNVAVATGLTPRPASGSR